MLRYVPDKIIFFSARVHRSYEASARREGLRTRGRDPRQVHRVPRERGPQLQHAGCSGLLLQTSQEEGNASVMRIKIQGFYSAGRKQIVEMFDCSCLQMFILYGLLHGKSSFILLN